MEPIRTFKFAKINDRLIQSLIKSEIYFSVPEKLNDPFDCRINVKKALDNAISQSVEPERRFLVGVREHMQQFISDVERDIQTYGVWSFSRELINPLMWAHYSDEHRGLCLTYELPENFWNHQCGDVVGVSAVDYGKNQITQWFVEKAKEFWERGPDGSTQFGVELITLLLTAKDECWHYEQENRVIARYPGPKPILRESLVQVCFGLRTSPENIKRVQDVLSQGGYKPAYCRMDRNGNDFGLRVVEI